MVLPDEDIRHEGAGREAPRSKALGQRGVGRIDPVSLPDDVVKDRILRGEERRERGECVGGGGEGVAEHEALPSQRVRSRRRRPGVAIGSDVVRPRGVEDEQKQAARRPGLSPTSRNPEEEHEEQAGPGHPCPIRFHGGVAERSRSRERRGGFNSFVASAVGDDSAIRAFGAYAAPAAGPVPGMSAGSASASANRFVLVS